MKKTPASAFRSQRKSTLRNLCRTAEAAIGVYVTYLVPDTPRRSSRAAQLRGRSVKKPLNRQDSETDQKTTELCRPSVGVSEIANRILKLIYASRTRTFCANRARLGGQRLNGLKVGGIKSTLFGRVPSVVRIKGRGK